jgi:hypothetical protein
MSGATARPEALAKGMVVCKRAMPLKRDEEVENRFSDRHPVRTY